MIGEPIDPEREAILDQFRAAPPELRAKLILGWSELDGALVTRLERVDNGWYNRALVDKSLPAHTLEEIVRGFRAAGSKNFTVELGPEAVTLADTLVELGLSGSARWSKITREAAAVESSEMVRPVEARDALLFGRVSCAGWGQPPPLAPWVASLVGRDHWHAYLAWDHGEAIATGLLYVSGENGWMGGDATLLAQRGKGAQSALIARRVNDAARLGVKTLFAETVENGGSFRNAEKLGFRLAYVRESFSRISSK